MTPQILIYRRAGFPLTIYSTKPVDIKIIDFDNDPEHRVIEQLENATMTKEEMKVIIDTVE